MTAPVTRRTTLAGAAVAGVPLLAACGSESNQPTTSATGSTPSIPAAPSPSPTTAKPTPTSEGPQADVLARTSDIPVGGGRVFPGERVVVTQPTEGDFQGFSAVCTHRGCLVSSVRGGSISCPCHGSSFSIEDGSVVGGPASAALSAVDIAVDGDEITLP